jgi:hypothetical protein
MKTNLPYLNKETLDFIFENAFLNPGQKVENTAQEEKIVAFLYALTALKDFNYRYRENDVKELFELVDPLFNYDLNAEGTAIHLALVLAIKDIYGFSNEKLIETIKQLKPNN